jgi:hypothetical protein
LKIFFSFTKLIILGGVIISFFYCFFKDLSRQHDLIVFRYLVALVFFFREESSCRSFIFYSLQNLASSSYKKALREFIAQ